MVKPNIGQSFPVSRLVRSNTCCDKNLYASFGELAEIFSAKFTVSLTNFSCEGCVCLALKAATSLKSMTPSSSLHAPHGGRTSRSSRSPHCPSHHQRDLRPQTKSSSNRSLRSMRTRFASCWAHMEPPMRSSLAHGSAWCRSSAANIHYCLPKRPVSWKQRDGTSAAKRSKR